MYFELLVVLLFFGFLIDFQVLARKVVADSVLVARLNFHVDGFVPEHASFVAARLDDRPRHRAPGVLRLEPVLHRHQVAVPLDFHRAHRASEDLRILGKALLSSVERRWGAVKCDPLRLSHRRFFLVDALTLYWRQPILAHGIEKLILLWNYIRHDSFYGRVFVLPLHSFPTISLRLKFQRSVGRNFTTTFIRSLSLEQFLLRQLEFMSLLEGPLISLPDSGHFPEHRVDLTKIVSTNVVRFLLQFRENAMMRMLVLLAIVSHVVVNPNRPTLRPLCI